jgi:hypothetical protein
MQEIYMIYTVGGAVVLTGSLAKSLGIKPGSKEFKKLKNTHDLPDSKPEVKVRVQGARSYL